MSTPSPATRSLSRRQFTQRMAGALALGLIDTPWAARITGRREKRLSWRAHRTAGAEGTFRLERVEGEVPRDLAGTLYRTAPGESERFGTTFSHLFDGDAFLSGYSFRDGKVSLRAQFLAQPGRLEEQKAKRMIFSEFGTRAPGKGRQRSKNQPSVNVIAWDGRLLGLSEGGHPTAIDPSDFSYGGTWDFHGTLPGSHSFTAHPKFDADGTGYCYGIVQGPTMALRVYRMEKTGKLTRLYDLPQRGYFMVHDMVLSSDHIVFLIPPVTYDLRTLFTGQGCAADALRYAEKSSLRILVLRKDGKGAPVTCEGPASMVFHHGNAFEADGHLHIDTFLNSDGAILRQLHAWANDRVPEAEDTESTRLVLDVEKRKVVSRTPFGRDEEFPRFDSRQTGRDARYLYVAGQTKKDDPFAFQALVRHDRKTQKPEARSVASHQTVAEPVFVARAKDAEPDQGWLLQLGYDGKEDQTFLDVVDAQSLERAARVWTGTHLPLGFHGNFVRDTFVKI